MVVGSSVDQVSTRIRSARIIAFYLPQFHPIPENDTWWGKGFTEWTNVGRARPLFPEHYQPHIPGKLGFYDLRLADTRLAQAELASRYGIDGFCYWHYWFEGKRLLERPFSEVMKSDQPRFPFCLAWANETWSRRWLGEERDVLLKQTYSLVDDYRHARWLTEAFGDERYLRVSGRPLFLIYRPRDLPDPRRTTDLLRGECVRVGLPEPFLIGINAHASDLDFRTIGFDGTLDFEPDLGALEDAFDDSLRVYDYAWARQRMRSRRPPFRTIPSICVGWDNTPRRGNRGIVIRDSTPKHFEIGLQELIEEVRDRPEEERLVFINAWNEWAEGNHLEPDIRHGLQYLDAVKRVVAHVSTDREGSTRDGLASTATRNR